MEPNLKNMGLRQSVAFQGQNEIFKRLASIGNVASLSPEERRSYEADLKYARDTYSQLKYATEEGFAKGLSEGREKGLQEGRAEGRAEGEILGIEKTARNLKKMGFSALQIHEATGLELEQIESL